MAESKSEYEYKGRSIFEPAINIKVYLLRLIRTKGPLTRSELVKDTGIPRTTIYDQIVKLMLDGLVRKYSKPSKSRGRPRTFYETVD